MLYLNLLFSQHTLIEHMKIVLLVLLLFIQSEDWSALILFLVPLILFLVPSGEQLNQHHYSFNFHFGNCIAQFTVEYIGHCMSDCHS